MSANPWLPREITPTCSPAGLIRQLLHDELADLGPVTSGPLPTAPLEVSQDAYASLSDAGVRLIGLLRTAVAQLGDTSAQRLAAVGIDPSEVPLFQHDEALEADLATAVSRADVVIGPGGPQFLEFNVAGAVTGPIECHSLLRVWADLARRAGAPPLTAIDPLTTMAQALAGLLRKTPAWPRLAVLASLRDYPAATSTRRFELELAALREAGIQPRLYEPEAFGERGQAGAPETLWANFTVSEWQELEISLEPIRSALDRGTTMIPSQSACFVNSKRMLALLSEGQPWMSADDRAFADRWIPWTRTVSDRKVVRRGQLCSLPELLSTERERLVLKYADGMKGAQVWVGRACEQGVWDGLVERATVNGSGFVAQEYVEPQRCPVELSLPDGQLTRADIAPVISPFVFDGLPGGMWVRFTPDPDVPVVARNFGAIDNVVTWS